MEVHEGQERARSQAERVKAGVRGHLGSRRDVQNAEVYGQAHKPQMRSNSWTLHQADQPELGHTLIVEDRGARRNYGADRI